MYIILSQISLNNVRDCIIRKRHWIIFIWIFLSIIHDLMTLANLNASCSTCSRFSNVPIQINFLADGYNLMLVIRENTFCSFNITCARDALLQDTVIALKVYKCECFLLACYSIIHFFLTSVTFCMMRCAVVFHVNDCYTRDAISKLRELLSERLTDVKEYPDLS